MKPKSLDHYSIYTISKGYPYFRCIIKIQLLYHGRIFSYFKQSFKWAPCKENA